MTVKSYDEKGDLCGVYTGVVGIHERGTLRRFVLETYNPREKTGESEVLFAYETRVEVEL